MNVLKLEGYESLKALNVFHSLLLGLKMLPAYQMESYEEFLNRMAFMEPEGQEKLIREAALFVVLDRDEVEALCHFVADPNGARYRKENLKSMGPKDIHEMVVAVCMEVAKIKISLVTESEKKNLKTSL